jgi:pimeloyl-ACP methyl ester carboxylesterase
MAAYRLLTHRRPSARLLIGYRALVPLEVGCMPPLVLLHGDSRRSGQQFRAFLPKALMLGLPVIAPTFDRHRFARYQCLEGAAGALAALAALESALADAQDALGLDTSIVDMFGYSAGAQFAHRYLLLSGGEVRRTVLAGAGWYTYLDEERTYPLGIAPSRKSAGRSIDAAALLRQPIHVLVGARDVRRGTSLRTDRRIDRRQGPDRLTRALRWVDHLEEEAQQRGLESCVTFDLLPDTGHSFASAVRTGGLVDRALHFLHAPPDHLEDPSLTNGSLE